MKKKRYLLYAKTPKSSKKQHHVPHSQWKLICKVHATIITYRCSSIRTPIHPHIAIGYNGTVIYKDWADLNGVVNLHKNCFTDSTSAKMLKGKIFTFSSQQMLKWHSVCYRFLERATVISL